jgi:hypothetical protein
MGESIPDFRRRWFLFAGFIYVCVMILGFFTVQDYGMSWDERFRFIDADSKLEYYDGLLSGKAVSPPSSNYPGLYDLPLAWIDRLLPDFGTRSQKGHVWSLCFGLAGLFSAWRLTARLGGERAGFFGLIFLVTLPRYYGHMFMNPKDLPLAAMYLLGIWALVELLVRLPKMPLRYVVAIGLAAGLAMSVRVAGFLILCYFGLFICLHFLMKNLQARQSGSTLKRGDLQVDLIYWGQRGLLAGLIASVILFIFWPALHTNPFESASQAVATVSRYGWDGMVLMDGMFWKAIDLPIYYVPYWILVTLPEHILILLVCFVALGGCSIYGIIRKGSSLPGNVLGIVLVTFSSAFPVIYLLAKDPVLYDGARHFLFAIAPLACVSALALEKALRLCPTAWIRRSIVCVVLLGVTLTAAEMVRLHPYQYVYFNYVSGGLEAAYNRDETDYWGLSHKEAGEWLNDYAREIDPGGERIFKVHQRYTRWMLKEALDPEHFKMWQPREGADFFVSITRFNMHLSYPEATLLHVVEREGVPLCFVYAFEGSP